MSINLHKSLAKFYLFTYLKDWTTEVQSHTPNGKLHQSSHPCFLMSVNFKKCIIVVFPMGICKMFGKDMETAASTVNIVSDLFTIYLTNIC